MKTYYSLTESFHYEETIQKSRFIADIIPITTEEEARAAIQEVRGMFPDATHHCTAYRIGIDNIRERSSDDGEPSGTAGRPMLSVLQHRELTNLVAVVTRYFGGIKLGTGGLVRAYGGTLSTALDAAVIHAFTPHRRYRVTLPYSLLGSMENDWRERPYIITERNFAADVTIVMDIPLALTKEFMNRVTDLSAAAAIIEELEIHRIPLPLKE